MGESIAQRVIEMADAIIDIQKRLKDLETFLPILREEYAGKIAGVSGGAVDIMETLGAVDPEQARAAVEANSGAAVIEGAGPAVPIPPYEELKTALENEKVADDRQNYMR